jgi:hypothetical protein
MVPASQVISAATDRLATRRGSLGTVSRRRDAAISHPAIMTSTPRNAESLMTVSTVIPDRPEKRKTGIFAIFDVSRLRFPKNHVN